jgi:ParB family chromosome partitioning protein
MANNVMDIPVENIHPNPDNPRYEAGDVTGLARSIEQDELMQTLLVVPAPEFGDGHYMIVDGYRRWVAGKEVADTLPCMVRHPDPDEDPAFGALITGLGTDVHKSHLSAIERAKAYGRLQKEYGMTQEQIGERLGLKPSTISRYLSLLELSDRSQAAVRDKKLTVEQAVKAVQKNRATQRKKTGKKPAEVGWEPDHFSAGHILARKAATMCDAREHNSRRRLGGACGACWETAIRGDERKVVLADYGLSTVPVPVPITPDGAIRFSGSGVAGAS